MDILIYGDIGGHYEPFMESLARYGVDTEEAIVPEGTVIIQVGDLVHRGPQSEELVAWVDRALKNNDQGAGTWIQLLGNHEGHHVGGPTFGENRDGKWHDFTLEEEAEKTLKRWWKSDLAHMAASVTRTDFDEPREVLVTHAGLTWHTWVGIGEPFSARSAAVALNSQGSKWSFAPGWMLGGYYKSRNGSVMPPSVAWASAAKEVYPSWEEREATFDQVHGHSTIWHWTKSDWFVDYSIGAKTTRDGERRFTRWENGNGHYFYSIDQALGSRPPEFPLEPLRMVGEVTEPLIKTTSGNESS